MASPQRSPAFRPLVVAGLFGPPLALLIWWLPRLGYERYSVPFELVLTAAWIVGLYVTLTLLRAFLIGGQGRYGLHRHTHDPAPATWRDRVPRLLVDLLTLTLLGLGTAVVLSVVWGQDIGGLLAALGIGSIVIGLALQDTLGNLIAGLALLFEKPYRIGDWIRVDGVEGQVVEVNWRALRLRTRDREMLVVPNSHMAGNTVQNYTAPDPVHAERVVLGFSYSDPPNKVKFVLRRAATSTAGVLSHPEPTVRCTGYDDSSIGYEVRLFVSDFEALPDILDRFNSRIWYAARRAGLTIPFPIRTLYNMHVDPPAEPEPADPVQTLRGIALFAGLDDAEVAELAERARPLSFGRGEVVVRQGEPGDAMYVLTRGEAEVRVRADDGTQRRVGTVPQGGFFGEMALLCGEARSATVAAPDTTDLETLVLLSEDLAGLLERRPELAEVLADTVQRRRAELDTARSGPRAGVAETERRAVLDNIRRFFRL